jgi:hypothetical protein
MVISTARSAVLQDNGRRWVDEQRQKWDTVYQAKITELDEVFAQDLDWLKSHSDTR